MQSNESQNKTIHTYKNCDNRGLTLIELIVAIAIMALITIPFLHAFITSANLNVKSANLQRQTNAAQNVMEVVRSYSLEDVATFANGFNTEKGHSAHEQTLLFFADILHGKGVNETLTTDNVGNYIREEEQNNGSSSSGSDYAKVSCVADDSDATLGKFVGQPSNKYVFDVKNIKQDNKYYDAKVILNASKYYDPAGESGTGEGNYFNSMKYAALVGYQADSDYMVMQDASSEAKCYSDFKVQANKAEYDEQYFLDQATQGNIRRSIVVQVEKKPNVKETVNGKETEYTVVSVSQYVSYTFTGAIPVLTTKTFTYETGSRTFKTPVDQEEQYPRNLIICYHPWYCATSAKQVGVTNQKNRLDRVVIENNDNISLHAVLLKQTVTKDADGKPYAGGLPSGSFDQSNAEQNYAPTVVIKEGEKKGTSLTGASITLQTNFDVNVGEQAKGIETSESEAKALLKNASIYYFYDKSGQTYVISGDATGDPALGSSDKSSAIKKVLSLQKAEGEKEGGNLIYDVAIQLYETGSYDKNFVDDAGSPMPYLVKVSSNEQ